MVFALIRRSLLLNLGFGARPEHTIDLRNHSLVEALYADL
jgi:hypothetical protein